MKFSSCRPFFAACAVLCLLATGSLQAEDAPVLSTEKVPLGSTPQQIAAFYGPMLRHNARVRHHQVIEGGTVIDGDLYSRNGLVIRVVFHGGVAVLLEYTRVAGVLTAPEANVLLAANAGSGSWEAGKDSTDTNHYYHRADGKALAHYTTEADGSLLVASEDTAGDFYGGRLLQGP